jgi:hypothetical protein
MLRAKLSRKKYQQNNHSNLIQKASGQIPPILKLALESNFVYRLSIRDLIKAEPFHCCAQQTRHMRLNIVDIIELLSQWIIDINDDDFPICLPLVEEQHHTKDFDLLDLTTVGNLLSDLACIKGIVVSMGVRLGKGIAGIFPGLFLMGKKMNSNEGLLKGLLTRGRAP